MPWSALSRFGGDADGDGRLDGKTPGWMGKLGVFPVVLEPSSEACTRPQSVHWLVDGAPLPRVDVRAGAPCRVVVGMQGEGSHTVVARTEPGVEQVADIQIDDRLVVTLGDSVASGEGNPQGPGDWLDPPCHRSAAAGFQQAARLLSEEKGQTSITFVSLACSGAKVTEGLINPYEGVAPDPSVGKYKPQVARLATIERARPSPPGRGSVDAVLVSAGANDVRFSKVVEACGLPGDCRRGQQDQVFSDLETLPANYDRLGEMLKTAAPGAPVLITEYFDPTRDVHGNFCRHSLAFTTEGEARWSFESLLRPLNAEVAAAAERNHWRYVGGIADDFQQHGYCAGAAERWVQILTGSLYDQGGVSGTLHPNLKGQLAIAQRLATALAGTLGLQPPPPAPAEEDGRPLWEQIGLAIGAVLAGLILLNPILLPMAIWTPVALVLGLAWLLWQLLVRLLRLLRPTNDDPAPGTAAAPKVPTLPSPQSPWQLLALGGAVVALLVLAVLTAGFVGSVILWLRFWSSHLPADQSVDAVSKSELVATGTQALAIFVVLGLLAVGLAWLLDAKGQWVRATRRGLLVIAVVELIAAVLIGDFRRSQALQVAAGLVVGALLVHFLVDRALELNPNIRSKAPGRDLIAWLRRLTDQVYQGLRTNFWRELPKRLLMAAPFALLLLAVVESFRANGPDRKIFVVAPLLVAAAFFVAPWGLADKGTATKETPGKDKETPTKKSPELRGLEAARIALAIAALTSIAVLLTRDAVWLAGTAAVAVVLALFCLSIAAASKQRFAPYALAILVSIPLFGAAATLLRGIDSPELQPVAAILKSGTPVCGVYIGESDGKLWIGHLTLDDRGSVRRPRRGNITSIDSDRIAERVIGPLEPVARAQVRAVDLRDQLLNEHGDKRLNRRSPTCDPPEPAPKVAQSWQRRLAERYQPQLILDRQDGFWPIPVKTLFSMQDRRAAICREVAPGDNNCLRLGTQGQFPWAGGQGEGLDYPAADTHIGEQHDLMVDALGSADPDSTATEYFLVSGGKLGGNRPITIQYWFFYSYNYLRVANQLLTGGFHEGDWESVSVLVSAKTLRARYVWMNRHSNAEGRAFPWDDNAMAKVGDHPTIFVARGSHASYESCGQQTRKVAPYHLVDDRPTCNDSRQLHLVPEATPLTDLSHVAWGCWGGHFGHRLGGRAYEKIPSLIDDAPLSPLWQQNFGGVHAEPCLGVNDPGNRDGPGEEVVKESTGVPARLRDGAGTLDPAVDGCADWENPPTAGTYMVACDQDALTAYLASGLEDTGTAAVRIDDAKASGPDVGEPTLPAVRRDPAGVYFDNWRITAANPDTVTLFASCIQGDRIVDAHFSGVRLVPNQPLHLLDRGPGGQWRLADDDGAVVAVTSPSISQLKKDKLADTPPPPGQTLACGGD